MKIEEAKDWLQMTSEATDLLSGEIEAAKLAVQLMDREPLVQEVIAKHKACIEAYKAGSFAVAEEALFEAVQNLAAWKP